MITCIIVDDEYPARVLLTEYANKVPNLELKQVFKNPLEAIEYLQKEDIDLIFLDIQMPELSGIQLLNTLKNQPKVVFTTAYSDYALDGYKLRVMDYLLKPISFERFLEAVNKVTELVQLENSKQSVNDNNDTITIKADHKTHRLFLEDIVYIEGMKEYVRFHTNETKLVTLESLKKLENDLPNHLFLRVHKSFIVNKNKVKSLYGNQLELNGDMIPIGKSYKDKVLEELFN